MFGVHAQVTGRSVRGAGRPDVRRPVIPLHAWALLLPVYIIPNLTARRPHGRPFLQWNRRVAPVAKYGPERHGLTPLRESSHAGGSARSAAWSRRGRIRRHYIRRPTPYATAPAGPKGHIIPGAKRLRARRSGSVSTHLTHYVLPTLTIYVRGRDSTCSLQAVRLVLPRGRGGAGSVNITSADRRHTHSQQRPR